MGFVDCMSVIQTCHQYEWSFNGLGITFDENNIGAISNCTFTSYAIEIFDIFRYAVSLWLKHFNVLYRYYVWINTETRFFSPVWWAPLNHFKVFIFLPFSFFISISHTLSYYFRQNWMNIIWLKPSFSTICIIIITLGSFNINTRYIDYRLKEH